MRSAAISVVGLAAVCLMIVAAYPFAEHAVERGLRLFTGEAPYFSRLFSPTAPASNIAIYGHMVIGGALTLLAPLQLVGPLRRRLPALHRAIGYSVFALALATSLGGTFYILTRGTIGGLPMTLGFGLYGVLVLLAAVQTVRYARQRHPQHRVWAVRLVILAMGSWIYRVHYELWHYLADGAGIQPDFTGPFDRVQVVAFYLPNLIAYEILRRRLRTSDLELPGSA